MSVSQLFFDVFFWVGKKGAELWLPYQEFGIFQSLPTGNVPSMKLSPMTFVLVDTN